MPTLSIRVDDELKAKIDRATEADGKTAYADYLRDLIAADLEARDAAGKRKEVPDVNLALDIEHTPEFRQLQERMSYKEGIIEQLRVENAHLWGEISEYRKTTIQLALPPPAAPPRGWRLWRRSKEKRKP